MDFHLFTELFAVIDKTTATFANDVSSRAISAAAPVISAGLTLSFIFYGLLVSRGAVDASIKDFFWRCFKISIIVAIATSGGLYQSQIVDAIQKTPDELASALVPSSAQGSTAASAIDQAAATGFQKATEAFENSGIFTEQGLAYAAIGVLLLLGTLLFTGIGGAFMLLAKIALALLAAIGPIYIYTLLFKSTQRFFENWVGQCVNHGLIFVFVTMIFGFLLAIFQHYMNQFNFDGTQNIGGAVGGCLLIAVVSVLILIQVPNFASGLAGGLAIGLWHEVRIASGIGRTAASTASTAGKAAGAAVGGAVGAGRAIASGTARAVGRFRGSRAA
ncbi:type IV secretion system protein [Burkholderia multivorans]|uniref:type IV secretion system protein n=2 Tax=Burkholderia multivorans TaxID=87883 RepID=UPI001C26FC97|nr:type IV secretion system protein [Burkholderia multivorans]MBU9348641.1 type IV secretion system protein [Burkholderia multivorans]MDR8763804.1 Type IV secretion system protein VirB6 [Burkholderia multivorans]MDR8769572.1 Type IV secretion system protein VirB6 [Burkholderia multivorans]MDR8775198.1 Type IV secretion system protein VirB6 [Burkholderia multivorans]MDR8793533.1 Type IV secretion system protein VirB6 [Burkholderia multivorans]